MNDLETMHLAIVSVGPIKDYPWPRDMSRKQRDQAYTADLTSTFSAMRSASAASSLIPVDMTGNSWLKGGYDE